MSNSENQLTVNDVQLLISEKLEESILCLEDSVFSVYAQGRNKKEKMKQIGTAFLYKIDGNVYFITASHVMESAEYLGEVYIANKSGAFAKLSSITDDVFEKIICNEIDFYICKIQNYNWNFEIIQCNSFSETNVPEPCIAFGFPNSKNKSGVSLNDLTGRLVGLRLGLYNKNSDGTLIPDDSGLPYFQKWRGKKSIVSGKEVNSIHLRGMSGSPCFYVPIDGENIFLDSSLTDSVKLVGILIEHENDIIKFVRFSEILKHIS